MKLKIIKKKYFSKNYFPKELNGNLTQIKPTKTNRSSVEHKVVLVLSYQLISNIYISAYILTRGDMNSCFVSDRYIIFQIGDQLYMARA
jgi:hypothetical protein